MNSLKPSLLCCKAFLVLLILLRSIDTIAQSGGWQWGRSPYYLGPDVGATSVTTDIFGNVYVIGFFNSSTIIFGTDTLVNPFPSYGGIYLVKYDSFGNVLWAKCAIGNGGYTNPASVATTLQEMFT